MRILAAQFDTDIFATIAALYSLGHNPVVVLGAQRFFETEITFSITVSKFFRLRYIIRSGDEQFVVFVVSVHSSMTAGRKAITKSEETFFHDTLLGGPKAPVELVVGWVISG